MNIQIVEPSVTLVDSEQNNYNSLAEALMCKVERCGRIAYKSVNTTGLGATERFIKAIVKRGHYSVLEHVRLMIKIRINSRIAYDIFNCATYHRYIETSKRILPFDDYVIKGNLRAFKEWIEDARAYQCPQSADYIAAWYVNEELSSMFPWVFQPIEWDCPKEFKDNTMIISEDPDYHTFHVVTDRGIMAEWTRHRNDCSYTVESTRYCNYNKKGIVFCQPTPHELLPTLHDEVLWQLSMQQCATIYNELIERGIKPEIARNVLPMSLKSEFMVTMTDEAWKHFLELRTAPDAHPQIRYLANSVHWILNCLWGKPTELKKD